MMRAFVLFFLLIFSAGPISQSVHAIEASPTGAFGSTLQNVEKEKTYISPFLERDRLNIVSLGDWMAHGVWWGLYDQFKKDRSVNFTRNSNYASGFVRKKNFDWNARLKRFVSRKRVDVALLSFGSNDGRDMNVGAEKLLFNTTKWREIYSKRVDQFIITLKQHGSAIYWLGLPIVRNEAKAGQYRILNGIYKKIARKNDIKFIESWHEFADKSGKFTYAGLDINDKPSVLRAKNGLQFTISGYRKLGRLVGRVLNADLSAMDAASKSSLEGSGEKEIAILSPDSGVAGSLTPETEAGLETGVTSISQINSDPLFDRKKSTDKMLIDTIAEAFGDTSSEVSPTSLRSNETVQKKVAKPVLENTQNTLASPEVELLLKGKYLAPKQGRDDDYTWPRQL